MWHALNKLLAERARALRPWRVLVVDDEVPIRNLLDGLLTDEGYETRTAQNGVEALAILGGWRADLVLLDLSMPVMNGIAFCRAYQEHGYTAPIVVVSAGTNLPWDTARAGAVSYLAKPFDLDTLLDLVETHCPAA